MKSDVFSKFFLILWLLILLIIGIYIRINGANAYYFSEDELMHISIASATTLSELLRFANYETHPPTFYIVLHYWLKIFHDMEYVRCLPLLFGMALIPIYFKIGKLVGGELAGICCATLITFSYGAIIQSYVVRDYALFLFFLSCNFYFYLLWHMERKTADLARYLVFAILASLTHLSAIFAIFSVAVYETIFLYIGKSGTSNKCFWLLANAVVVVCYLIIYYAWAGGITPDIQKIVSIKTDHLTPYDMILLAPVYWVKGLFNYIFINEYFIYLLLFFAVFKKNRTDNTLNQLCTIAIIALLVSSLLFFSNRYPFFNDRHILWLLPFLISVAGGLLANFIRTITMQFPFIPWQITVGTIFTVLLATYSAEDRFQNVGEYLLKEKDRTEMINYLEFLDNKTLIVSVRDDAILLTNIYPSLSANNFSVRTHPIVTPYLHTNILFDSYFRRALTYEDYIRTLRVAEQQNILDNVTTLLLMKTNRDWKKFSPLPDFFNCDTIHKEIFSFGENAPVSFMKISKKEFFDKMVLPNESERACMGNK